MLWHADVCHGPALNVDDDTVPLSIHAILDAHSRYVVALAARSTTSECEMLGLMVHALRLHRVRQQHRRKSRERED